MACKHNEDEVLKTLRQKKDVLVTQSKEVLILNGKSKRFPKNDDLGNGSLGKIDFLTNHCGYTKRFVSEF